MSSMAKIFVVINLVLAVVAFGSAATLLGAQDDYKSALEDTREQFDDIKKTTDQKIDNLEAQIAQQTTKASTEAGRAKSLEAERNDLNKRLSESQNVAATLRTTLEALTREVQAANKINQENKNWLDKWSGDVQTATQEMINSKKALEEEVGNRLRLEEEVGRQNETIQDLSATKGDLEKQVRELNFWLAEYRKRFGDITPGSRGSEGRVNSVRDTLVVISVGSEDGVRVGDVYHLRRGGTYVGQIQISKVEKNLAVGEFDDKFAGAGAPPQRGDVAYPGQ
ncbi:MAG: hypothetical protein ACYTEZ_09485 [Planctomycetota bacterium]|jgi:uncharacterized coiled-coil protein SlyX